MNSSLVFDQKFRLFRYPGLEIPHAITTRHTFDEEDFNLSFHTGEEKNVSAHRHQLKAYFSEASSLTVPKQCHGVSIYEVGKGCLSSVPEDTDALVTNVKGQLLGVLSADCVPVLLFDPVKRALGLAHAGWKGTVASIGSLTLQRMIDLYGCNPSHIRTYIGPSISQANFEVGQEVVQAFRNLDLTEVIQEERGHYRVDLWKANAILLQRSGVLPQHSYQAHVCTYDTTNQFYSARKEGFATGRFGVFAML